VRQGPGVSRTMISMGSEYVSMETYENISSGDVNLRSVPLRCGLLEDSAPRVWGSKNILWHPSTRSEYILITYAALSIQR
jgi:hypothetical protein